MSEKALLESISLYESQLEQVNLSLQCTENCESLDDLIQLKSDLQQLIDLTKDNLLEVKKKQSLEEADAYLDSLELENNPEDYSSSSSSDTESISNLEDTLQNIVGMKCQAPFGNDWQQFGYHNAIVTKVDARDASVISNIKVTVFYCNPVYLKMAPCPYYLEGKCRFSDTDCRQSHGSEVSFSELKDFQEPNFNLLQTDVKCLAKTDTGLWAEGIIHKVIDERTCRVYLTSIKDYIVLNWEDILPLEAESDGSDEDNDDQNEFSLNDNSVIIEDFAPISAWTIDSNCKLMETSLGTWEKHTKGIGSKLLFQMGYKLGEGLGPKKGGRIEPVEAIVYPKGKSLDHCMDLKSSGKAISIDKKKKKPKKNKVFNVNIKANQNKPKISVFEFLNEQLKNKKEQPHSASTSDQTPHSSKLKETPASKLNVENFKIGENIRKAEKDMCKLKEALKRNKDRHDIITVRRIEKTIAEKQIEIENMKKSEKAIKFEQASRNNAKKLSVF